MAFPFAAIGLGLGAVNLLGKALGGGGGGSKEAYNAYQRRLKGLEYDTKSWGPDVLNRAIEFDPSAAVNEYAQGAWGSMQMDLSKYLDELRGGAVGAGRLDTGLYDYDQGQIMNEALSRFTNQLSQTSLGAASLEQQRNQALMGFLQGREGAINEGYAGMLDYETGLANARGQSRSALYGALGQVGGSAVGMLPEFISLFRGGGG